MFPMDQMTRNQAVDELSAWGAWNARRAELVCAGLYAGLSLTEVASLMGIDRKTAGRVRDRACPEFREDEKTPRAGALQQNQPGGVATPAFKAYDG